jgi:predicted transposase/invertase (TIGR01784 family)
MGDKPLSICRDESILHFYRMREMAIYDYISGMSAAKEEGREKGDLERSIISTINLRQAGFSATEIAKFIGKTTEEINKILGEQGLA